MNMMKTCVALVLLVALNCSSGVTQQSPDEDYAKIISSAPAGAERITAKELGAYVQFLAADELEGRDTPSRGLDIAANFIASNLTSWGLDPLGDHGTYFQQILLRRDLVDIAHTQVDVDGVRYLPGEDFIPLPAEGASSGSLVYAGDGWFIPSKHLNPYQGIDIQDKTVVILGGGLPKSVQVYELASGDEDPYTYAQHLGAKAVIRVPNLGQRYALESARQAAFEKGNISAPSLKLPPTVPYDYSLSGGVAEFPIKEGLHIPMITALPPLINALFGGEKLSATKIFQNGVGDTGEAFAFNHAKRISLTVKLHQEDRYARNVVALLEGSDPQLKKQYVVVGAHYDHLGMEPCRKRADGHEVYNGADDNGSGSAALLAIAHAFSVGLRPKRSILFVWYSGEEKGEWGSKFITTFSPVPLASIIAQLNMDMIGRTKRESDKDARDAELTGPSEVYVSGSKMLSTELGELSEAVNNSFLKLTFNYHFDDPQNQGLLDQSDDASYLRKGIPVVYYSTGFHADYHATSDTADKIDLSKMEKISRTVYATAHALTSVPHRPRIDGKLPPTF
jgi:hypothetical protein